MSVAVIRPQSLPSAVFRCIGVGTFPVPRNMIKFNPGFNQILRKVFFSKNSHVTQTFKILLSLYSEIQ